jgi:CRISPR-associated exonuclease Cas4
MFDRLPALPLALVLIIAALVLFWMARHQKRKSGLPEGRIIYTDTQGWMRVERPLYSPELNLTGKPDYLVEHKGQLIPVEVKSSHPVNAPYDSHINQLGAYCLLVEHCYGKRPPYGILRYPEKTYAIDFTSALEDQVLSLVAEMQNKLKAKNVNRSHESPQRCAGCGYRSYCDQALRI